MNNFIFWGSDEFSIEVLKVLISNNLKPKFCITQPNKPKGRKLILTPPPIKNFCEENNIEVLQPEKLSDLGYEIWDLKFDYFVVASYGKIIQKEILDKTKLGALNVHPSLLPKYRGASPIETAILNDDKNTGVTIMLMDEKMDHGPILLQRKIDFREWKPKELLRDELAKTGGEMLVEVIPKFLEEKIAPHEQNHEGATFTKLIKKEDGEILESDTEYKKWLKFVAYNPWPGAFFFIEKKDKKIRVKIADAVYKNEKFEILKVIPEGKSEMDFKSFQNGYSNHRRK